MRRLIELHVCADTRESTNNERSVDFGVGNAFLVFGLSEWSNTAFGGYVDWTFGVKGEQYVWQQIEQQLPVGKREAQVLN